MYAKSFWHFTFSNYNYITKFIIGKNVFQWHHVPSHRAYLMVPVQFPEVVMIVPVKMALEEQIVKVCRNI
jgi:hypothetical protein